VTGCIAGCSHDKCSPEAKGKPCPLHCRPDGSNIGNGSVSNADPYSHMTYNAQDMRTNYPSRNATLAHYAYAYDIYVGNSSYLEMELAKNYKDTSGKNKVRRCRTCSHHSLAMCPWLLLAPWPGSRARQCLFAVWLVPLPQHLLLPLHLREAPGPVQLQPGAASARPTCPALPAP
jgi:hypothetical protein